MKEVKELVAISKYAGERFDLVQAAGGNSSVKLDSGEMLIKASGYTLSDVTFDSGYSTVLTNDVANVLKNKELLSSNNKRERENITSALVKKATLDKNNRPSIETLLHSVLLKYTLHTHPIAVNVITALNDYKQELKSIFKDVDVAYVDYETPGIELAIKLDNEIKKFKNTPQIIFLQNHGLIVTSNKIEDIEALTESVLDKIINHFELKGLLKYGTTNKISKLLNSVEKNKNISYLCQDSFLNDLLLNKKELFLKPPFCPDTLVYCGVKAVEIDSYEDKNTIINYNNNYYELPKVIICDKEIFFIAPTLKKAREIEEVFKIHIMILNFNYNRDVVYLENDELAYLSNWEAEKYRQNL